MSERERSHWAWGYTDAFPDEPGREALAAQVGALLGRAFSLRPLPTLESARLPEPRVLPPTSLAPISSAAPKDRIHHTYGKGYRDLVRAYRGDFSVAPDWVSFPQSEEDIERLLAHCAAEGIAVIPYGGGTSVVGGVEASVGDRPRGVVSLDLRRLDRVLDIEPVSRSARIQAGATGPVLEEQLAPHGLTLRHFPQSFEFSTLGGWIATRAGGHFATLYTHIDDLVSSVRMITPAGTWASRRLPASGAGPSPDRLALGSEGILGVITEAWVRLQARPRYRASASVTFPHFADGARACRLLAQSGLYPSNCRLLDRTDALLGGVFVDGGAVLLLAFESADHPLGPSMNRALEITAEAGGVCPEGPVFREERGEGARAQATYKQSFFRAPYLQSALVSLGVLADTFETACTWDRFEALDVAVHEAVLPALQRTLGGGILARRFTHVYPDGPAPYYTFLGPAREGHELETWAAIKDAASHAILASGGTITHHHAVGRVHRPYFRAERPEPFERALRAAKRAVDPAGIMNPGALFEPDER
ncbi:FAD-binding oxidoreductase [Polyangium fumosum]|uniref:FAD-binding oxidoreductase n=1 Tax=Polyangium fumosum TaxID=889272 RepID=A0A4V5PMM7_9BACT|nr:FAD-binding oxidoreductase [Polyangium fumosum]TKD05032.1 FAD-binding oxidoreductase [Polyangium fumosum]